jgi:hypothetical protein
MKDKWGSTEKKRVRDYIKREIVVKSSVTVVQSDAI